MAAITQEHMTKDILSAFLLDKRVSVRARTLQYYQEQIGFFIRFCDNQGIGDIQQITADTIRRYLLHLEDTGHNPGGCHAAYRAIRAFLYWWEAETEPDGWSNPIKRVKAPRVSVEPLEPVQVDVIDAILKTCEGDVLGLRDRAIVYTLADTGVRARELLGIDITDINATTGEITIRRGKGGKSRPVFLGRQARRAVRRYLKARRDGCPALFVTCHSERLTYGGLRQVIRRRAKMAGVDRPALHDFRRYFALSMLRAGVDVFTIQRLMGHSDLQVLRRYLAQTTDDLQEAHRRASPADSWKI